MAVNQYISVTPASGDGLVHIAGYLGPELKTACELDCSGWKIALARVTCDECKLAAHLDARPKRQGKGPSVRRRRR